MKTISKATLCIMVSFAVAFSFTACNAKVEATEESVNETVGIVLEALQNFDSDDLKKYVDSNTLSYIVSLADEHEQFAELGKAMFEGLEMKVVDVDLEAKTVSLEVTNKDLFAIASNFTYDLTQEHSKLELLSLLNDDSFLDYSLSLLRQNISEQYYTREPTVVTLNIVEGKKNLILQVDEEAEDAISGGALKAVTGVVK